MAIAALTKFEADLLRVTRGIVEAYPTGEAVRLLNENRSIQKCFSADAVRLIEQTLSRGVTRLLARQGALPERTLRFDAMGEPSVAAGRLWERTKPEVLGLRFSVNSLWLLQWLLAADLNSGKSRPRFDPNRIGFGDRLLMMLVMRLLQATSLRDRVGVIPMMAAEPLLDLMFPTARYELRALPSLPKTTKFANLSPKAFLPWMKEPGASLLEALQPLLQKEWENSIETHRRQRDPELLRNQGEYFAALIGGFYSACEQSRRRDLARFLTRALRTTLGRLTTESRWFPRVNTSGLRIADRTELYRAAGSPLSFARELRRWQEWSIAQGFYDDDYIPGQHFKDQWEREQVEETVSRAEGILRGFDGMTV